VPARPTVLLIDPQADRLRELGQLLTAAGYEVVPLADVTRARRFAEGLEAAVIVVTREALEAWIAHHAAHAADGAAWLAGAGRTLVVLGADPAPADDTLPEAAAFLPVAGVEPPEIARRLLLVLLGRELGAAPDASLTSLVGDLAQRPLIELLRGLAAGGISGRIDLRGGSILLHGGEVIAAAAGAARGLKAFCRLGRLHEGPFRLVPGELPARREIEEGLDALVLAAIEDSLGEFPDPRVRLEVLLGPSFFASPFSPLQQRILGAVQHGATLRQILDGLPDRDGEIVAEVLGLEERGFLTRREPAVQIVTDSTADLPADLAGSHGIAVVPLTVAFGQEVFRDRVDLQPGDFYQLLKTRKAHPVSGPPAAEELARCYGEWLARGHDVVSIHLSARLSKTCENAGAGAAAALAAHFAKANAARAAGPENGRGGTPEILVVDTGQISLGLGLLVLFAARMAARNETAAEIRRRLLAAAPRVHSLFALDTLELLARGGRIGRAQAMLGGLLGIKPILGLVDGEVAPVDRVRGGRAAHPRILEILRDRVDPARPVVVGLSHGNAAAWADRLEKLVRDAFPVAELIAAEVGPVVGTHAGPGVVGVSLFQPEGDEGALFAPL
jgi:DegV family protein with EDD domain